MNTTFFSKCSLSVGKVEEEKSYFKIKIGRNEDDCALLREMASNGSGEVLSRDDYSVYIRAKNTETTLEDAHKHFFTFVGKFFGGVDDGTSNSPFEWDKISEHLGPHGYKVFKLPMNPASQKKMELSVPPKQKNGNFHLEYAVRFNKTLENVEFDERIPTCPEEAKKLHRKEGELASYASLFENFSSNFSADLDWDVISQYLSKLFLVREDKDINADDIIAQ